MTKRREARKDFEEIGFFGGTAPEIRVSTVKPFSRIKESRARIAFSTMDFISTGTNVCFFRVD